MRTLFFFALILISKAANAWISTNEHKVAQRLILDKRLQSAYENSADSDTVAKCKAVVIKIILDSARREATQPSQTSQDTKIFWMLMFEGIQYSERHLINKLSMPKATIDATFKFYTDFIINATTPEIDGLVRNCKEINEKIINLSGIISNRNTNNRSNSATSTDSSKLAESQASRHINNRQNIRQIVKIGHVGPLSGPISHLGIDNENGARMAIEELNASNLKIGDKVLKFELIKEDDAADPKQAVASAQRLVAAKVNGVIGHLNSGTSIPASLLYNTAGIPQISPSATNPKYTRQGYSGAFRLTADEVHLGRTLGKFAVQNLKAKSIAVIDDRTAYGSVIAEEFKKGATAFGGSIVAHEYINFKTSDFTTLLAKLKENNTDVIFFGGMDDLASQLLRQMRIMGINAKFLGGDGICTNDLAALVREAMKDETVFCAEPGGVQASEKEGMDKFRNDFKARFNNEVQIYAPYAYDAVMVMAAAMLKAGSTEPEKYLPALKATKYKGVTGVIEFDEKGDIKNGAVTLYTYRNRQRIQIGVIR